MNTVIIGAANKDGTVNLVSNAAVDINYWHLAGNIVMDTAGFYFESTSEGSDGGKDITALEIKNYLTSITNKYLLTKVGKELRISIMPNDDAKVVGSAMEIAFLIAKITHKHFWDATKASSDGGSQITLDEMLMWLKELAESLDSKVGLDVEFEIHELESPVTA